ncbi:hypothetical protein [Demequina sp. SO4-18]|uniref:hypothetical protein n=1 Tax=Demequina sp. SO4-18 TaxID=3401026 RepID=UPI003B5ACE10
MSTDTADYSHARRRSDRAGEASAASDDVTTEPEAPANPSEAPAPASAASPEPHQDSTEHYHEAGRDDLAADESAIDDSTIDDDGSPDGDDESDASEADEIDDPATTPIPVPQAPEGRGRRRSDRIARHDARGHVRRRTDEPRARAPYDYDRDREIVDPPRTRGRAGWIAATIVFVMLFGGAAALDYYLWNTAEEWETRAEMLTEANYDLGARLSGEQQTTMQLASEIDLLTQQLATSNQKVTDLSSEKANAVDESAFYLQQIDALEGDVSSASGVANALHRCVDGQQELVTYLRDAENYEPEELEDFSESVRELCAEAEAANDRLQNALSE